MDISFLQSSYCGFDIDTPQGNNAFSYDQRSYKRIFVPPLIDGGVDDVLPGDEVVFSDLVEGAEVNACGLRQFVHMGRLGQDIFVFDNHNHAFSFWAAGVVGGVIKPGVTLVHVDQHKDTREPGAELLFDQTVYKGCRVSAADVKLSERARCRALRRDEPARLPSTGEPAGASQAFGERNAATLIKTAVIYANTVLNVGNFIPPALKLGWFNDVVQIGNADAFVYNPPEGFVLDIDLDIFAPVMDYIPEELKIARLRYWISRASFVTIATSPFFMDQVKAIERVRQILSCDNVCQ